MNARVKIMSPDATNLRRAGFALDGGDSLQDGLTAQGVPGAVEILSHDYMTANCDTLILGQGSEPPTDEMLDAAFSIDASKYKGSNKRRISLSDVRNIGAASGSPIFTNEYAMGTYFTGILHCKDLSKFYLHAYLKKMSLMWGVEADWVKAENVEYKVPVKYQFTDDFEDDKVQASVATATEYPAAAIKVRHGPFPNEFIVEITAQEVDAVAKILTALKNTQKLVNAILEETGLVVEAKVVEEMPTGIDILTMIDGPGGKQPTRQMMLEMGGSMGCGEAKIEALEQVGAEEEKTSFVTSMEVNSPASCSAELYTSEMADSWQVDTDTVRVDSVGYEIKTMYSYSSSVTTQGFTAALRALAEVDGSHGNNTEVSVEVLPRNKVDTSVIVQSPEAADKLRFSLRKAATVQGQLAAAGVLTTVSVAYLDSSVTCKIATSILGIGREPGKEQMDALRTRLNASTMSTYDVKTTGDELPENEARTTFTASMLMARGRNIDTAVYLNKMGKAWGVNPRTMQVVSAGYAVSVGYGASPTVTDQDLKDAVVYATGIPSQAIQASDGTVTCETNDAEAVHVLKSLMQNTKSLEEYLNNTGINDNLTKLHVATNPPIVMFIDTAFSGSDAGTEPMGDKLDALRKALGTTTLSIKNLKREGYTGLPDTAIEFTTAMSMRDPSLFSPDAFKMNMAPAWGVSPNTLQIQHVEYEATAEYELNAPILAEEDLVQSYILKSLNDSIGVPEVAISARNLGAWARFMVTVEMQDADSLGYVEERMKDLVGLQNSFAKIGVARSVRLNKQPPATVKVIASIRGAGSEPKSLTWSDKIGAGNMSISSVVHRPWDSQVERC
jgi:hypothetical protein